MYLLVFFMSIIVLVVKCCIQWDDEHETAKKLKNASEIILREMEQQGLGTWPLTLFEDPAEMECGRRAFDSKTMKIVSADRENKIYEVLGEHSEVYTIQNGCCSCMDFRTRKLPCKHMFFVNMRLDEKEEEKIKHDDYDTAEDLAEYVTNYGKAGAALSASIPAGSAAVPAGSVVSVVDEIRGLKQLLDEGILTEEEFTAKKKQLLGI